MNTSTKTSGKIRHFLFSHRVEWGIFLLLSLLFICHMPEKLHQWNAAWYAMDYSLGFGSRLLIGSLLKLLFPSFLPAQAAYALVVVSTFLLLFLLSWALGCAFRQMKTGAWKGLLILTALYLVSPGSPAFLWTEENMGRFDLFLLILTLVSMLICFRTKSLTARFLLVALLGTTAMAVHQVYLFIYFPLLFLLILLTAEERRFDWKSLLGGALALLLPLAAFVYFQFFASIRPESLQELLSLLSARTDLSLNEVALNYEYFADAGASFRELTMNGLGERIRYGLVTLLLLSPLLVLYVRLWARIWKNCRSLSERFPYILALASYAAFLPAFALTIDWGRWFAALLTVQFLQILILAAFKKEPVVSALDTAASFFRSHPVLLACLVIFLASLDRFDATLLPQAPEFFYSVYRLLHLFS